jgi:hypothetical protein
MQALQDTLIFCKFCVMMPRGTDVSEENIASVLNESGYLPVGRLSPTGLHATVTQVTV